MLVFSWSLLNLLAWGFGLKAVYDLRAEWVPRAKTWFLVTQAVLSCLTMEAAMVGSHYVPGLAVLSAVTGAAAGILMYLAVRSLVGDLRLDRTEALRGDRNWDRIYACLAIAGAAAAILAGQAAPRATAFAVAILHPLEGAIWLAASGWIVVTLMGTRSTGSGADGYLSRAIAPAFLFAFGASTVRLLARLTGFGVPPQVVLLDTLFILTFVMALYGTVIHLRGHKLAEALRQVHEAQGQILGVEKMVAVSTLAAGAAHDFNNSLMVIMGHHHAGASGPRSVAGDEGRS